VTPTWRPRFPTTTFHVFSRGQTEPIVSPMNRPPAAGLPKYCDLASPKNDSLSGATATRPWSGLDAPFPQVPVAQSRKKTDGRTDGDHRSRSNSRFARQPNFPDERRVRTPYAPSSGSLLVRGAHHATDSTTRRSVRPPRRAVERGRRRGIPRVRRAAHPPTTEKPLRR